MTLRLYNTLSRTLEPLTPLKPPAVTMYVCGPTVYDDPHLGHVRSASVFDVLARYLRFKQFTVRFVRNVTDVDDKIIEKARQEAGGGDLRAACGDVAERYLASYHAALKRLGLADPTDEPRATEHVVPDMTDFISTLLMQGAAYEAGGNVYFSVRHLPGYGQLSNRTVDELQAGARVEPEEDKRDPADFALWKAAKPGEPSWASPWGEGRPGWHIECSTMSTKYLGERFDIHGGGVDLVFPHHENELAQARAAGKPFATRWVHHGLLTVNGEKMSKSLGNYVALDDALARCGGEPDVLKLFFLGTHYRSPIDYTDSTIQAAKTRFEKLFHFVLFAQAERGTAEIPETAPADVTRLADEFERAMDDDLSTSQALATLEKLANLGYEWEIRLAAAPSEAARAALQGKTIAAARQLAALAVVLGLQTLGRDQTRVVLPDDVRRLIQQREAARKARDFEAADQIRQELSRKGWIVEDTAAGPVPLPKR